MHDGANLHNILDPERDWPGLQTSHGLLPYFKLRQQLNEIVIQLQLGAVKPHTVPTIGSLLESGISHLDKVSQECRNSEYVQ